MKLHVLKNRFRINKEGLPRPSVFSWPARHLGQAGFNSRALLWCKILILRGELQDIAVGDLTLRCLLTPGPYPGGISPHVDIEGTRVLFGQDMHGPFDPARGSDMKKWKISMLSLPDLKADILCEGYYGIYQPAGEVKRYIETYLRR